MYKERNTNIIDLGIFDAKVTSVKLREHRKKINVPDISFINQIIGYIEMLSNKPKRCYALKKIADSLASTQYDITKILLGKDGFNTLISILPETNLRETEALFSVFVQLASSSISFSKYFYQNPNDIYSKFQVYPCPQAVCLFSIIVSDNSNFINYLQQNGILSYAHQVLGENQTNIELIEPFANLFYLIAKNNLILAQCYADDQINYFNKYCDISHLFFNANTPVTVPSALCMFSELCKVTFVFFDQLFPTEIINKIYEFTIKKQYFDEVMHLFINIATYCVQFINVFFDEQSILFSGIKRHIIHSIKDAVLIIPLLTLLVTYSDEMANLIYEYEFLQTMQEYVQKFSYSEKETFFDFFSNLTLKIGIRMLDIPEIDFFAMETFQFIEESTNDDLVILALNAFQVLMDCSLYLGNHITKEDYVETLEELSETTENEEIRNLSSTLASSWH